MAALIYLMGASGVGKDSLLRALREAAPGRLVAHRYITRASNENEDSIRLSEAEFIRRQQAGLFCLAWQAHGLHYALGIEIEQWLSHGHCVIANGSRAHLDAARTRFGHRLAPLLITAEESVVRERLIRRGRDSADEIEARLERHRETEAALSSGLEAGKIAQLDNSGTLSRGVAALCCWLATLDEVDNLAPADTATVSAAPRYHSETCS